MALYIIFLAFCGISSLTSRYYKNCVHIPQPRARKQDKWQISLRLKRYAEMNRYEKWISNLFAVLASPVLVPLTIIDYWLVCTPQEESAEVFQAKLFNYMSIFGIGTGLLAGYTFPTVDIIQATLLSTLAALSIAFLNCYYVHTKQDFNFPRYP